MAAGSAGRASGSSSDMRPVFLCLARRPAESPWQARASRLHDDTVKINAAAREKRHNFATFSGI